MNVADFNAKPYNREFLPQAYKARHERRFFDARLSPDSIAGCEIRSRLRLNQTPSLRKILAATGASEARYIFG